MAIPAMQWAQVAEKPGHLVYKQIPVPTPGPDEILVKVRYTGVCHTDLHAMKGDWPIPVKMPLVGGHEGTGHVVAKGALVHDFEVGDHAGIKWLNGSCLACEFCRQTDESQCNSASLSGYTVDGTFQQYTIGKAAHAAKLSKDTPLDAVAPVLCAGITVYKGLKEAAVRPGQTVAIVGAGGGLGSLALQYAKAMGLRVVAIDGGDEKREMCQELGAEVSISDIYSGYRRITNDASDICGLYQIEGPRRRCSGGDPRRPWGPRCHPSSGFREAFPASYRIRPVAWHCSGHWPTGRRVPQGTGPEHCNSHDQHQGKLCRQPTRRRGSDRLLQSGTDQSSVQAGSPT